MHDQKVFTHVLIRLLWDYIIDSWPFLHVYLNSFKPFLDLKKLEGNGESYQSSG